MYFDKDIIEWVNQNLANGATDSQLIEYLVTGFGYSLAVATSAVSASKNKSNLLEMPAKGTRPDIPRDDEGQAYRRIAVSDGRTVELAIEMYHPQIFVFRGLISAEMADAASQAGEKHWGNNLEKIVSGRKELRSCNLPRNGIGEVLPCLAAQVLNWPVQKISSARLVDYEIGGVFDLHHDAIRPEEIDALHAAPGASVSPDIDKYTRVPRIGTLIICLSAPDHGGGTYFANIGMTVNLGKGDAVYFGYDHRTVDKSGTLHAGDVVHAGRKQIATLLMHTEDLPAGETFSHGY